MQPHRRRCVRPPAPEKDSKHFMKAILPPPVHTKEIRIPDEFITRFGSELNNVATITIPDGCEWEMELKKSGNEVFICNNWQKFVEYYSIGYGCYLDFKYEGNSKFNVVIYDTTSVEISYPFKTPSTNGEPNIKCPNSASKRAKYCAKELNPKNPYFRSKSNKGRYVYVPAKFAEEYLKPNVPFKLQNSQGKQWEVSCVLNTKGKSPMRISIGFCNFARENSLLEGVTYVFQLIKRKPVVVLQVTAIHTPGQESEHFKKAILPSPIHDKEIKIPDEFITRFGKELKNVATVTVPDGRDWKMRLKKCGNDIFFYNEWQEFAEYYSIGYGCYLSFKYEGNSKFSVIIFDATSVEICYPFKTQSTDGETNTKYHSPRKRSRVETSENHGENVKSMSEYASKTAEEAAREFNPKNPYFRSKIANGEYVYVSADFASKYLKPNDPIKLQISHTRQWEVFGILHDAKSSSAMQISKGFSKFQRDNNLSPGDYCVSELIRKNPVVLKVTMFRAVDYHN